MKSILSTTLLFSITTFGAFAQNMYSKAFGDKTKKPLIYLHGGPGYNSTVFEVTTAQTLANKGFYVIVYDRRGEGRSKDGDAQYTFKQTFEDLNALYKKYGLEKASLLGHSFGGIVATQFAERFPSKVENIILVSAPISLQETFTHIIATSKTIYESKDDKVNLNYISMLENMDTTSLQYSSYSFMHAMQNGFYSPKQPTTAAVEIYGLFTSDTLLKKYASNMGYQAPQGFWENEHYTTIDLSSDLKAIMENGKTKVYGIYGKEDGLYAPEQIIHLKTIIGDEAVLYLDNASHNVFIDQQSIFIDAIKKWVK